MRPSYIHLHLLNQDDEFEPPTIPLLPNPADAAGQLAHIANTPTQTQEKQLMQVVVPVSISPKRKLSNASVSVSTNANKNNVSGGFNMATSTPPTVKRRRVGQQGLEEVSNVSLQITY